MVSLGIRCGAGGFLDCRLTLRGNQNREKNGCVGFCNFKANGLFPGGNDHNLGDFGRFCRRGRMAAVASGEVVVREERKEKEAGRAVVYEKMDEWMRDSVVEIVKNLKEAPLLVNVYSSGEVRRPKMETGKAVEEEDWPAMIERWKKREERLPEGVIFVERLEEDNAGGNDDDQTAEEEGRREGEEVTRAWGIVVQGRGVDCGPICYLLKTSSGDDGSAGLGLCCTHFCLMRVKSFRETARSQFKNCWLLQGL